MKLSDLIKRSIRNLRTAKARTLLTALAIAVGGFTLTLTLGAGNGVRNYTDTLVATNFDPAELIVGRDPEISNTGAPSEKPKEYDETVSSVDFGGPGGSVQVKRITQKDIQELKSLPFIEQVRENYQVGVRYITIDGQKRYTAAGEIFNPAQKPEIKAGSLGPNGELGQGRILLPESYLGVLNLGSPQEAVGKVVQINVQQPFSAESLQQLLGQAQAGNFSTANSDPSSLKPADKTVSLRVAGVTKKPATSLAVGQLPIVLNNEDARELYDFTTKGTSDFEKYLYVNTRVKDGENADKLASAKSELEKRGYTVQSSKDIQKTITQFVNILQTLVGVFAIITLLASVFGIINTQYISVLERTREIGLMKALGMRSRDVRRLFIFEASWIGFLGGFIGAVGALVAGSLLNPWITKKLDLGNESLIIFKPSQIVLLLLGLMAVGALAGYFPARKAAKMNPIDALRSE